MPSFHLPVSAMPSRLFLLQLAILCAVAELARGEGKEESRPYEFGFVIEGEQHRYEKKDEKGIIMGEYGFITADGVYHVTVYATDENGSFRILKTRNIRIGLKMVQQATGTSKPTTTTKSTPKLNGLAGCSGCLIPTTTEPSPPIDFRVQSPALNADGVKIQKTDGIGGNNRMGNNQPGGYQNTSGKTYNVKDTSIYNHHGKQNNLQAKYDPNVGNRISASTQSVNPGLQSTTGGYTTHGNIPRGKGSPTSQPLMFPQQRYPGDQISTSTHSPTGGYGTQPGRNEPPATPVNYNQIGGTPKTAGGANTKLSDTEKKIMEFMARLYKFNYTLSFHGHEEEGDITGSKRGSYFSNGRDGYQRKVEYLANEFGYQPKISLVKLDPASTPDEMTEKERTRLKGNQFIWFHEKPNKH